MHDLELQSPPAAIVTARRDVVLIQDATPPRLAVDVDEGSELHVLVPAEAVVTASAPQVSLGVPIGEAGRKPWDCPFEEPHCPFMLEKGVKQTDWNP